MLRIVYKVETDRKDSRMIRVSDGKDIEKLLKDSRFTDEIHKERLWRQLQKEAEMSDELSEDELAMAAGGVTPQDMPSPSKQQA